MKRIVVLTAVLAAVSWAGMALAEAGPDAAGIDEQPAASAGKGTGLKALFNRLKPGRSTQKKQAAPARLTRDWLDAQPDPDGDANWACLSEALYFEARGETVTGQFAVAEVIMNRVKSSRFPDTPCAVIKQGTGRRYQCQFTYTCDGHAEVIAEKKAFKRVSKVARAIIDGVGGDLTDGATFYHTVAVRPSWARKFTETARIGVHVFYRPDYRTAGND
jgi:spore germination cell wall hydrolase CwlJ-like protein